MNQATYRKLTIAQLKDMKVRSVEIIRNGYCELPPGTIFTIQGKFGGLDLKSDPCSTCGIAMHVRKVNPLKVVLI